MVGWRRSLVGGDLQNLLGKCMALWFAVLLAVLLVFVGGSKGGGATKKLVRDFGLVCGLVLGDESNTIRRKPKSQDLERGVPRH